MMLTVEKSEAWVRLGGHNHIESDPVFRGTVRDRQGSHWPETNGKTNKVSQIGVKELLEAGVHFGHQTRRWNPQMKPYIFEARNGIHVINLNQTATLLQEATDFLSKTVSKGGTVLFVGTKKQAQAATKEAATACGQPYVTERWLADVKWICN